jgi:hypothetical protein
MYTNTYNKLDRWEPINNSITAAGDKYPPGAIRYMYSMGVAQYEGTLAIAAERRIELRNAAREESTAIEARPPGSPMQIDSMPPADSYHQPHHHDRRDPQPHPIQRRRSHDKARSRERSQSRARAQGAQPPPRRPKSPSPDRRHDSQQYPMQRPLHRHDRDARYEPRRRRSPPLDRPSSRHRSPSRHTGQYVGSSYRPAHDEYERRAPWNEYEQRPGSERRWAPERDRASASASSSSQSRGRSEDEDEEDRQPGSRPAKRPRGDTLVPSNTRQHASQPQSLPNPNTSHRAALEMLLSSRQHAARGYETQAPLPPLCFKGKIAHLTAHTAILTI